MKVRNKKTGKIFDWQEGDMPFGLGFPHPKSLAELNEEWEDYKPAEPLIKDEKIRKAVCVWAELSGITKVMSYGDILWIGFRSTNTESVWKFECNYIDGLEFKQGKEYTIAELCGEEEE